MEDILTDARYLGKQIDLAKRALRAGERLVAADCLRRASDALERITEAASASPGIPTIWGNIQEEGVPCRDTL